MSEKAREHTAFIPDYLYRRIRRDIVKEKYVTPYLLAEKYNTTISLAKQVLRRLEREGVVRLYAHNRRAPIYVPVKEK
ncbi:MAG TPA: 30S ribosomal protein S25e [Pyrodictium sp.]|nr:30S ribosomal protein S25e [Pyrodictium sp.]